MVTAMSLVIQGTWTLLARVLFCCSNFSPVYSVKSTGSMGDTKIFAGSGGILLPDLYAATRR